jgi:drug/metabolite transporter (DMT)-like permease
MSVIGHNRGIYAALTSALCLGVVPIFGKLAINSGFSSFAIIALRTGLAMILMLLAMAIWMRPYFYIYPVGLFGCLLAGFINGLGSVFYYTSLTRLDASVGHMLYSFYPLFVAGWLLLDRQPITRLTTFRLLLSVPAVFLILQNGHSIVDLLGTILMLASAVLYALHLIINQRILYEVPAPTVTFYTLIGMSFTVALAFLFMDRAIPGPDVAWWAVLMMALITFFSRFALFLGLKKLGGLHTALLGLGEVFVTIALSQIWLGERLSINQWIGCALLGISLLMVGFDKIPQQKRITTGWLSWLNPPKIPSSDFPWNSQP